MKENNKYNEGFSKVYDIQGQTAFSLRLFQNFMKYCDENRIKIKTHLDVACGTGAFCFQMYDAGIETRGVDISEEMLKIAEKKKEDRNIVFWQEDMTKYISEKKYDLITCNYDAINHLLSFEEWEMFFQNCYQNLNDGGYLLFDFNTLENFTTFDNISYNIKNKNFDLVSVVAPINNYQALFRFNYYILEDDGYYSKLSQSIIESFFANKRVIDSLKKTNFKNIKLFDERFAKCTEKSDTYRIYVLCQKNFQL